MIKLKLDEIILFEDKVRHNSYKNVLKIILTSKKIILMKQSIILKKYKIVEIIKLNNIKIYKNKIQVNQKGVNVYIQMVPKDMVLSFDNIIKANKFYVKLNEAITGKTRLERGTEKIKRSISTAEDALGVSPKDVLQIVVKELLKK